MHSAPFFVAFVLVLAPAARGQEKPARTDGEGNPLPAGVVARLGSVRFCYQALAGSPRLAFLPDGKVLMVGGNGRPLQFWETASGKEVPFMPGLPEEVSAFALSGDGKVLALGVTLREEGNKPRAYEIQLYSVKTAKLLRVFEAPARPVAVLALSADGKWLAARGADSVNRVWEVESGKLVHSLAAAEARDSFGRQLAFSADGQALATLSTDHALHVWDLATGKELAHFGGQQGHVMALAFSPDGKYLATGQGDYSIRLWHAQTGKEVQRLKGHEDGASALAFSADGKALVSADAHREKPTVRLWDVKAGKEMRCLHGPPSGASQVALSADGAVVAVAGRWQGASGAERVQLWDTVQGKALLPAGDASAIRALAFSPDSKAIVTGSAAGRLRHWDVTTGKEICCLSDRLGPCVGVCFAPRGEVIVAADDKTFQLWESATGKQRREYPLVDARAISYNGRTLAYLTTAGKGGLVDVDTGGSLREWQADATVVAIAPDNRRLALADRFTGTLSLYEAHHGKQVAQLAAQRRSPVHALAFSADGRMLASLGSQDAQVRLWETVTGKERLQLGGRLPNIAFRQLSLSPDGRLVAVAIADVIHLLDALTGREVKQLRGQRSLISSLAFSPDGKLLASSSYEILLWDLVGLAPALSEPAALPAQQLDELWARLADPDAAKAYAVMQTARRLPGQAVPLLRERLAAAGTAAERRVTDLIGELAKGDSAIRDQAAAGLRELGPLAEPALRRSLKQAAGGQMGKSLQGLLDQIDAEPARSAEVLRLNRGIEVLEHISGADARRALEELMKAAPESWLAEEATAARDRLVLRSTTR